MHKNLKLLSLALTSLLLACAHKPQTAPNTYIPAALADRHQKVDQLLASTITAIRNNDLPNAYELLKQAVILDPQDARARNLLTAIIYRLPDLTNDHLSRPLIPAFPVQNEPLAAALERLAPQFSLPITADWQTLALLAVGPETPISANPQNLTRDETLDALLHAASPLLGHVTTTQQIRISTQSALAVDQPAILRVYDLEPQLAPAADDPAMQKYFREFILAALQRNIAPDSWRTPSVAAIIPFQNQLVILQTPNNHTQIETILQKIREARGTWIRLEPTTLLVANDFLDDFRIKFNPMTFTQPPPEPPRFPFTTAQIDSWTLNLLNTAAQADRRTQKFTPPPIILFNGESFTTNLTRPHVIMSNGQTLPLIPGITFTLQPTLNPDDNTLTTEIQLTNTHTLPGPPPHDTTMEAHTTTQLTPDSTLMLDAAQLDETALSETPSPMNYKRTLILLKLTPITPKPKPTTQPTTPTTTPTTTP